MLSDARKVLGTTPHLAVNLVSYCFLEEIAIYIYLLNGAYEPTHNYILNGAYEPTHNWVVSPNYCIYIYAHT